MRGIPKEKTCDMYSTKGFPTENQSVTQGQTTKYGADAKKTSKEVENSAWEGRKSPSDGGGKVKLDLSSLEGVPRLRREKKEKKFSSRKPNSVYSSLCKDSHKRHLLKNKNQKKKRHKTSLR